jgi:hypothetical protein
MFLRIIISPIEAQFAIEIAVGPIRIKTMLPAIPVDARIYKALPSINNTSGYHVISFLDSQELCVKGHFIYKLPNPSEGGLVLNQICNIRFQGPN